VKSAWMFQHVVLWWLEWGSGALQDTLPPAFLITGRLHVTVNCYGSVLQGTCMRGDSCKYSHDLAHIVQVSVKCALHLQQQS
jgi:hypothetical protein